MKSIFNPAVTLMSRLGYDRKFALLGAISLLTIALLSGMLYAELNSHISRIRHEMEGLRLIAPLSRVIQLTQQHRGLSTSILSGGTWMQEGFPVIDRATDEAFRTLDRALPVQLRSRADWQDIMRHWQELHGTTPDGVAAENFRRHLQLVNSLTNFESVVADEYELTLDPEFDTYYLIDTVIDRLPDALEHFGQLRAKGTSALVRKQVNEQQKLELYGILEKLQDALVSLEVNLEKTGRYNALLREAHAAVYSDIAASTKYMVEVIKMDIIPGRFATRPEAFFATCTAAIDSDYDKMYRVLLPAAEALLQKRMAEAQMALYLAVGLALLLFLAGAYLSVGIARSVAGSVRELARSARAFAGGKLDERVHLETSDELKQVEDSFNEMAEGFNDMLKARHDAELSLARSNADLTRFAEVSAHHLMEPVRRLSIYSQRLHARMAALPQCEDEEVNSALDTIGRDAAHLRILVRDIQLYLAAGEPRGEIKAEDVNVMLALLKERMAPRLAQLGAVIDVGPLPFAILDRPRLMDVFSVLLDNALQHGRPADPALPQRITISGERDGTLSRYSISDNGSGIPSQYLERVFEIFERLTPGGESGSGIGLAIARRIVESRNGKIWAENTSQGGVRVVFELPDGE